MVGFLKKSFSDGAEAIRAKGDLASLTLLTKAGMSRRYGGIHFARADLAGRKLGRLVDDRAWAKAQTYFDGTNTSPLLDLTASK